MSGRGLERELEVAKRVAREAGRILLEVYATPFTFVEKANEAGPVTIADERANAYVVDALAKAFPTDGIVAEETEDTSAGRTHARCWWVDPLDGTREFIARNGMFAVHVGLSIDGAAAVGVVYRPTEDRLWAGSIGGACTLEHAGTSRELRVPEPPQELHDLRLVVSRSHRSPWTEALQQELGITQRFELGSVGLKCGAVAAGEADLYVHPSPFSYRWDACAPEAVLTSAGGLLTDLWGQPYVYDGQELRNARGLLGCSAQLHPRMVEVTRRLLDQAGIERR